MVVTILVCRNLLSKLLKRKCDEYFIYPCLIVVEKTCPFSVPEPGSREINKEGRR
jgi:hypothetical protein